MPAPLGPIRRTIREIGLALITAGVIVLLFVAYQLWGTNLTEARNQSHLAKQFTTNVAQKPVAVVTASTPDVLPAVPTGGAIDHMVIPAIGVDKYVVEGTDENALRQGPGHYTGTAYPGQVGNAAIAGHRTTYGAPFFELNQLKVGDQIKITDLNDRTWIYVVSQAPVVVSPDDVAVLDPTPFAQLTLTTCNPRYEATTRLIVFARLQGKAGNVKSPPPVRVLPTVLPGDGPTTPSTPTLTSDNLGRGNSNAIPPTILYGLLTVVLWVATRLAINRTRRFWRLGAYVVGIGICLIPLWFTFENVILLLPQSI
ncbi:MAG TPA: class E sortase [Acidimicrobiales bacterium]|nr:class E sortase [Acidimicrobiales bacterium]